MIRIITGYSNPGGSTVANINLCNLFNEYGHECYLYGPHDFHLTKTKYGRRLQDLSNVSINDIIISHYMRGIFSALPNIRMHVLSLHEKAAFDLKTVDIGIYHKIHFLNEEQRKWHGVKPKNFFFCPNAHEDFKVSVKQNNNSGIIGSIEPRKQTHISIQKALNDKCDNIMLFGPIGSSHYFDAYVRPLMERHKNIHYMGLMSDKQYMYDLVKTVYHFSNEESASFVVDECALTGTELKGNSNCFKQDILSNEDVYKKWETELCLK